MERFKAGDWPGSKPRKFAIYDWDKFRWVDDERGSLLLYADIESAKAEADRLNRADEPSDY